MTTGTPERTRRHDENKITKPFWVFDWNMSMPWMSMPWPFGSPHYQQPQYRLFKLDVFLCPMRKGFKYTCPPNVEKLWHFFYVSLRTFSRQKLSYCVHAILAKFCSCTGRETKGNDHCCHWIARRECNKTIVCQTQEGRQCNGSLVYLSLKTADTLLLNKVTQTQHTGCFRPCVKITFVVSVPEMVYQS